MEIKLGDTVQVEFGQLITDSSVGERIDACMSQHFYEEAGMKSYRGTVIKIKTKARFGLVPFNNPVYYYVSLNLFPEVCVRTRHVKKVIRC